MKLGIQLGALSVTNIGVTFLFQWYILTQLGPGVQTDAFFAGMTVPQLVLAVISSSLMHVLVPLLAGENEERFRQDAWTLFILVAGIFGIAAIMLYLFAPLWVPLTVPGFDAAGMMLTVELTRVQLIGMIFTAVNGVQWAAYHARQRFLWAEFSPILTGLLALLLLMWLLPRFGVVAAAWISVLRMILQTLLLARGMGRPVYPNLNSSAICEVWRRIKPLLVGTSYYKTDPVVDRFMLSTAGSGSLSLYYLAQQIFGAMSQVLNKSIAVPLVPALGIFHKSGSTSGFYRLYQRKLLQAIVLSMGGLLVVALFGKILLGGLVGYGNVSSQDIESLWWIMIWLGGMLIGGVAGQITASTFYAAGDTRTPTRLSIVTYTTYVPCKVGAFYYWGISGLAMATSVYYMVNFLAQIWLLERRRCLVSPA